MPQYVHLLIQARLAVFKANDRCDCDISGSISIYICGRPVRSGYCLNTIVGTSHAWDVFNSAVSDGGISKYRRSEMAPLYKPQIIGTPQVCPVTVRHSAFLAAFLSPSYSSALPVMPLYRQHSGIVTRSSPKSKRSHLTCVSVEVSNRTYGRIFCFNV